MYMDRLIAKGEIILPRKKIVAVSETYDNLVVWEIPGYLFVCITYNPGFYTFAICII